MRAEYKPQAVFIPCAVGQLQVRLSTRSLEVLRACAAGEVVQIHRTPWHGDTRVTFSVRALADRRLVKRSGDKWVPTADGEAVLKAVDP